MAVVGLFVYELFYNAVFAHYLNQCTNVADALQFVKIEALQKPLMGRLIFNYMQYVDSLNGVWKIILHTVTFKNILEIVLFAMYVMADPIPEEYKACVRSILIGWSTALALVIIFVVCFFWAFSSGDTATGLNRLLIGANILEYGSIAVLLGMLVSTFITFYRVYLE